MAVSLSRSELYQQVYGENAEHYESYNSSRLGPAFGNNSPAENIFLGTIFLIGSIIAVYFAHTKLNRNCAFIAIDPLCAILTVVGLMLVIANARYLYRKDRKLSPEELKQEIETLKERTKTEVDIATSRYERTEKRLKNEYQLGLDQNKKTKEIADNKQAAIQEKLTELESLLPAE